MDMNEFVTTAGFALFVKNFFLYFFFFFFVKIKILTNNLKHKILRINTGKKLPTCRENYFFLKKCHRL